MPNTRLIRILSLCVLIAASTALTIGCRSRAPRYGEQPKREYRPAGQHDSRVWRDNAEAVKLIERKKYDRAEEELKKILTRNVNFGPAHNNLGVVYDRQNQMYQAAWEYEYAAKLMPHHPEPRNNLGLVHEKVGRLDEAIEQFQRAYELEPDSHEYLSNLARAKVRRGDSDEAMRKLLREVVLKDSRPKWNQWARERLVRMEASRDETAYQTEANPTTTQTPASIPPAPRVQILPLEPKTIGNETTTDPASTRRTEPATRAVNPPAE